MTDDDWGIIDPARTACLCDVGAPDTLAATVVNPDGSEHLVLAQRHSLGDDAVQYGPTCPGAIHDQLGPLPLDVVKRIAVAQRSHRCGRATESGRPCRVTVGRPGDACHWHKP